MKRVTFIRSLMEFNKRVLCQGMIDNVSKYTMSDLKQKLFFNKVFINNTQEMFQKHNMNSIMDEYIDELRQYINNVNAIISRLTKENDNIRISREDSFERRLSIEGKTYQQISSKVYININDINLDNFIDDHIYYISILDTGDYMISYVDMKSAIYRDVISCQMDGYKTYWKTDDCIRDHIRYTFYTIDTIAFKITRQAKTNEIVKVEYNGSTEFMKKIISMFPKNALIVSNPFMYIDDINMIIEDNDQDTPSVMKADFNPMTLEELMTKDGIIEYPNDSFDEYLQFLSLASKRNDVKSIYITLYRIGKDPSIFYILRDAVNNGIKVYVNVELCASGESINRMWMREMRNAGMYVFTYESGSIKVHCKLTLVEFENGSRLAQIGTGNYHTQTASQYTDLSIITGDNLICKQVKKVFDILTCNIDPDSVKFNKSLLVSRFNARQELCKLIEIEALKGSDGYIAIKCNALDDYRIIECLDRAAMNGCKIDLIIRGVCTWIPDENANVKIKSIIWDKLEHSRVFCFGKSNPTIYIGSLDLVSKKLNHRIETLVLLKDPDVIIKICDYMNRYVTNTKNSWVQTSYGMYIKE